MTALLFKDEVHALVGATMTVYNIGTRPVIQLRAV
jgi:hypothetical protein